MNMGLRRVGLCSGLFLVAGIFGISACGSGNSGDSGNNDEVNGILGRLAENLKKTAQTTSGLRARQSFLTLDSAAAEASATIDRICGMPIVRRLDTVPRLPVGGHVLR